MPEQTTILENIDNSFKSLTSQLNDMTKTTRSLQDELRGLHKIVRQSQRSTKNKTKRPQVKLSISKELAKFLDVTTSTKLTKAEVMKNVSTYIKEKNLQIQEDRRKFLPNKELSKIFGIKGSQNNKSMTFVEINKHVSHHLSA